MSKNVQNTKRQARRPGLEEIEPRILYSADFAPGLAPDAALAPQAEQRTVESSGEFAHADQHQVQTRSHEIVFVDSAAPDYEKLVDDIRARSGSERDVEIVLLDKDKDGIGQITRTLAKHQDVSAVHIVSHGTDGSVQLGKVSLNFDSLLKNGSKIKGWGAALSADADILIYGCNVAQSDAGRSLIDALARLTGADVAASADLTGHADLGGDWSLEFQAGAIDTRIVFSQSLVLDWRATLQGVAVGGETRANTTTSGTQDTNSFAPPRVVAMDANGNYVVVWYGNGTQAGQTDTTASTGGGVFFQRYDANGNALGGETRINQTVGTGVTDTQDSPAVAMAANGNFVVTWRSNNQDGGGTGIYARRYDAAGTALANEFRVNSTTLNNQDNPNIAMNASGAFVVAWVSQGQDGSGAGVYAQRYNAAGVAQGGEFRVNVATTGDQWVDGVALDAAGNFVVAFSNDDGGTQGVYVRRYDAAGTALGGEVLVNSTTAGEQSWSSIAMAPDGTSVVAWRSVGQDGSGSGIYAQRYNASGAAQGTEFRVNTTTANEQHHPAVAMDTNGNFMVVWASFDQDAAGTWGIYKQEYNANGTTNGGEVRVNSTTGGDQINPALTMNAVGQAVVAWAGNGNQAGQVDTSGVFFKRYATALVVDTTNDTTTGSDTSSISALVANKGADGRISLREAITAANNTANANANSPDRIYFNIPGAGVRTINVTGSDLPFISDALIIDGTTQAGFSGSPLVEIDGQGTRAEGLRLNPGSGGSTIKGLIVNRFTWAIDIDSSSNNVVTGNFLGTDGTGTVAKGNLVGVWVGTSNNTIGGTSAADRNIISGNTLDGVQISGVNGGTGNVVMGNYIGLNAAGTADLGNASQGIALFSGAANNTIGGTAAGAGNVISGNNGEGVRLINSGTTGNVVLGNLIGTNATGTAGIANSRQGVWIDNAAANNTIGGTAAGAANTIAYNTTDGVALSANAGSGNAVLGNAIFSNVGMGIDLLDDNIVLLNDGAKTLGQPNLRMDFPVIQSASLSGTTLTLAGYIGIAAGDTDFAGARVEFFKSPDAAGANGEGQVYLGFLTANASGNFSGALTVSGLALGERVSATATDTSNSTSEFGVNVSVTGAAPVATDDAYSVNEDSSLTIPAPADWWNTSWRQRKQLTFNNTGQAENLVNFAVLVEIDNTRINYALTQNAGQDLRFVDGNGTLLAHEIERWNESGTSYVWVSVPQIDASSGTDYIWMYYGNAAAADGQNAQAVWDNGFTGVWHLGSNELDSAGTNAGTNSGSTNTTTGAIGDGQSFDGVNDQVYTTTQFVNPQEYTVEAWFRTSVAGGDKIIGFENQQTGTGSTSWDRQLYVGTDGRLYFGSYHQPTDSEDVANSAGTYTDGGWHYAVGIRNDATNTLLLYVDGTLVDTSANLSSENYNGYWRMGGYKNDTAWPAGSADGYFNGSIDEVRVSTQVRSAAWVKAQHLSMTDTFVGFGAVQGIGVLGNDSDPNGDLLSAVLVGGPSNAASFTLNANGSFTYTPTANFSGTDSFTYRANDGTSNSNLATVTITVNPVNDAPTISGLAGDALAYVGGSGAQVIEQGGNAAAADIDSADFNGGVLTASITAGGDNAEDVLSIRNQGSGAGQIGLSGANVTYGGTLIGTAAGGSGGTALTVTLNANATPTAVTALIRNITYQNTDAVTPTTGARSVSVTLSDGDGGTSAASVATVNVSPSVSPVATDDAYSVNEDGTLAVTWWDSDWTRRSQITFTGNNFGGATNLTNFPVLIALNSGNINYAQTQNQGQDLRFLDANGSPLAYQIESWNESGTSYVWVKVPQVDVGTSDSIWMYYGNASAAAGQNPTAVWTAGFSAVYHLNDSGAAIDDATASNFDGTAVNGAAAATGQIAGGRSFDGTDDYINLGANRALVNNAAGVTVSGWINTSSVGGGAVILGATGSATPNSRITLERNGDELRLVARSDDVAVTDVSTTAASNALAIGVWRYVSGVVDVAGNTVAIYVDGLAQATTGTINLPGSQMPGTSSQAATIGANEDGGPGRVQGLMDEVRWSTVARSAAWVRAEYLSMTGSFLTVGAAQTAGATQGVLGNDSDPNADPLTAVLVSGPANAASFTLNADGTFTYTPTANFSGTDTFTYRANDGTNNSNLGTVTITVNPVNDAPTATITPATYAATEQTSLTLHGTGLTIADVDAGSASVTATLSVVSGTLTVTAGTSGAGVSGSGTNSVTLTGTLTQINNLLAGNLGATASYIISSDAPPASDTLTLSVNDGGNTGSGGAQSGSDTATINISAVNDAPTATITPATYAATEQTSLTLHGTGLSIGDVDAGSATVTATLSVVSGTLTVTAGTTGAGVSGSGTNSVTLTGTLTQINNLLAGNLSATATYIISSDTPPASDTLTLGVNDGGNTGSGGARTGSDTATINITALNDAPTAAITPATYAATEQTSLTLHGTGLTIADVDAGGASVTATLSVVSGTLTVTAGTTGAAVSGSGSNSVTLTGTLTQINNLLAGNLGATASYIISSDAPPATVTLTLSVNDAGNTGSGGAQSGSDTATINISAVNDAPTATITPATYAATEQTSLTLHGTGLSIGDVDAGGASVTATLSVVSGTLTVMAGTTGAVVSGSGSNSVTLTGTLTQINNLLAGNLGATASYLISSDTPPASDTLTLLANDGGNTGSGGALTGSDTATINIGAVNDAPTATITPATYSATEQTSLTLHGTGLSIADVDAGGASVTATLSVVSGTLTVTAGTTGAAVSGSGSNSVTLTGTLTQINNLLAGNLGATASYIISSDAPPASDTLTLSVNDAGNTGSGGAQSGSDTATINISAVNDAPTATITPATYAATEQTSLTLHGTGLSIGDVDAGGASVTATLSVVSGTLTVTAGTTGAAVSGSGSNSVTLTGTLTQINNLLAGNLSATATYIISSDTPPASDTLTLGVNDGGNTGSGGAKTGSDTATINIGAVNDAPTAAITPATYAATEQTSLTLHGTGLTIADVDAGSASVTATLSVVSGTLTVTAGTSGAGVSGSGTNSVTLTGTLTQINNLLAGNLGATASYIISSDAPPASDTLTLSVNDGGNTGSGGAQSGSDTATINISAVNDAPTAAITPATYAATEQTSLTLHGTGLSIGDVDAGGASVTATLSVVSGTLTVTAGTTGAGVSGSGTNSVTLTGTLTQINNLLAGNLSATATYIISSDTPPASDTLTLGVNDGGNTGSGGAQSGSDTATINIGAVNDAPTATITPATYAATEQTSLTLHGTGLSIGDVDAGGASLTATLSVVSGTLTVTAGTTGAGVSGSGTSSVTLTGTLTQINNLLAGNLSATATYIISSDTPPASDTLTLGVNDGGNTGSGGAQSGSDTATINIGAVNDAPTATITPATYAATEQTSLTLHGTGLSIGDVDAGGASVTATLSVVSGTLTVTAGTTGAAVSGSGSNSVTLTGTLTQINNLLAGNLGATASYIISSDAPPASDTLTLGVNDGGNTGSGGAQSGSDTATINIGAVNDAPTAAITPATYAATEQTSLTLHGTGLSIADVDAGSASVTATLSVVSGTLTVTAGTTGAGVSGSGTGSVTLTGTLTQINNLLAGSLGATVSYLISSDTPPASDTLTLAVNDAGNSGSGGAQAGSDTATINIGAVNDAPVNTVPAAQATTQNAALVFSIGTGNAISVADVDAGVGLVQITLTATNGTITLSGVSGLAFGSGDGTADATMSFTGALADINSALNGLSFNPTAGFSGPASLTIDTDDQGNTGAGGAQTASNTINVTVTPIASPIAGNDSYTVNEDAALSVASSWWNSNWQYREQLTFNNASRAENLVDFPILVAIDTANFGLPFYGQAKANGEDLRFVDGNGQALAYEIQTWNTSGISYVWVKVPQVDASSNSDSIWAYWGNAAASDAQNAAGVWSNGYVGVWHLEQTPGGAGSILDSTSYANNGTPLGLTAGDLLAGQAGNSLYFGNGVGSATDFIRVSSTVGDELAPTTNLTLEAWAKRDTGTGDTMNIVGRQFGTGLADAYGLDATFAANDQLTLSENSSVTSSAGALPNTTWSYVAGTRDATTMKVFSNGTQVGSAATSGSLSMDTNDVIIGAQENDGTSTPVEGWLGWLDEIRVSNVTRTADWLNAQYASMTGSFVSYGAQVSKPAQVGVLANDSSPAGAGLTAVLVTGPSNGAFTLNPDGTFSYTPNADFNGTDTFTYRANDGSTDSNIATVTLTVNSVNDAPAGIAKTVTTAEDTGYTFTASDFAFTDASDAPANGLLAVTITTLPGAGSLTLSGVAVTLGQSISAADLAAGYLQFTPAAQANGASHASFTFQVQDDGGTANSGANTDPTPRTMTIDVSAVNDAPAASIAAGSYSATEQVSLALQGTGLSIGDVDAGAASVTATLSVVSGTLTVSAGTTGAAVSGSGTNSVTLTGTLTQINALLAGNLGATASYLINSDTPPGSDTLTLSVNDGGNSGSGGAQSASANATINIGAVNDAPTATITPPTYAATEQTNLTLHGTGLSIADADAGGAGVTATLSVVSGSLTVSAGGSGVSVSGSGSNSVTLTGTLTQINDLLTGNLGATVSYIIGADAPPASDTLTLSVNDGGNSGSGGAQSASDSATINIGAVNDAPTASIAAGSYSATEQVSLALQGTGLSIGDVDAGGASVTATLSVVSGTLTVSAGTTGAGVAGSGSNSVTLTGTLTQINNLLAGNLGAAASYVVNSDTPPASDTLTLSVDDGGNSGSGGAQSGSANVTISIAAVNDAPTATITPPTYAATEQTNLTLHGTGLSIADADAGGAGVTATLSVVSGSLTVSAGGSGVSVSGSGSNSVTLTGTLTQINDLLTGNLGATVSYIIGADAPPASDTLTLSVNDGGNSGSGGAQSASDSATINIGAVNDAPTASIAAGSYSATEQTGLALQGTGLSIGDVDAGGASVTATLSVVSGTLTVSAGTTGAAVSGSGTNSVTLTGTLTQINALLAGNLGATASYLINSDTPPGSDTLTLSVNDGGNSGSGGAQSASANATINIGAVNDAPTATITPPTYAATEQTSLTLHGTGLSIADVDAGGADITATLSVVSGTLNVNTGTTGVTVGGSGGNSVTLSGTLAQINDLLAGNFGATASYVINSDAPPASDTLTLSVDDDGNTGAGGVQTGSDTATINISAVNDAPTATITPATYAATEQTSLTLHGTGLSIADVDAGGASVTATLSVVSGTLTVTAGTTGAAVSGSGTNSVTLTGTLTQINDLLAGNLGATASYLINSDTPPASDTLTLSVNDGGNTGSGGVQSASTGATITIGAVNDAPSAAIVPASYAATEQVGLTLHGTGLSIADADAGGASVTATLSVVSGTLTVSAGGSGALVSGSGSDSVTLTGTLTQINDLLAGNLGATVSYIIGGDAPPASDTLTLSVNDGGNSGSGGAQSASDSATISIGAVNDAPTASIAAGSYSASEQVSLVLHGTGLSIGDVDAGGASVTATLSVVSGALTVNAGTTGVVVGGSGSNAVTLSGTLAQINDLLAGNLGASASYLINSDTPPGSDTLTLSVNDAGNTGSGGAQSGSANVTINIGAVNDAPSATIVPASYAATEQTSLTLHGTGLSIGDVDAGGASVTATLSVVSGTLTVSAGGSGVSVAGSGTDSVTLTGTLTQINNLLAGNLGATASYLINSDTPPASDTLTLSVNDGGNSGSGGAQSDSASATINIGAVNDGPAATITPVSYVATEQTSLTLEGTGLAIGDVDAGGASVTATMSVVSGTLTASAGTTGVSVSGSGSDTVTLIGTLAQINDLLAGNLGGAVSYLVNSDAPPASDTLTLSVDDGGNLGSGGAMTASDTAIINISGVNDAPAATIAAVSYAATEQTSLTLHGTGLSIADVDADGASVTATLSVVSGTLNVTAGTTGVTVGGSGGDTVTLTGALAAINDLLAGNSGATASYVINSDTPPASDTLTLSVDDDGNTGSGGAQSGSDTATIDITALNDAPTGAVVIIGAAIEDDVLSADTSSIADADGSGIYSYQWERSTDGGTTWSAIGGATASIYTLRDADVNALVQVSVSYTDGGGTVESLTSASVGPVANVNDAPTGAVTVVGTVTEDQTLTADTSSIDDADGLGAFGYQWLRDGAVIVGATSGTYTLGDADVGTQISVEVSYTDGYGTAESLTSTDVGPVVNVNDAPIGLPTITGTVTEDQILTANTAGISDADGLGAFGYQWLRDGAVIVGATSGTYTLGDADVGTQISVEVSYTDGHGTAESVTSAQTAAVVNVNDVPIGLPTISGTVTEDQTLTANTGGIADADGLGAFGYQWLRNGAVILGATSGTYTLGDADVGTQISVEVSYTDVHGTSEGPLVSAQTAPVVNVNDAPIGLPTITGTVTEDQILTANTAGIADADGLGAFGYQWLRDGAVIVGATSGTYTLGDADVGTQISVEVSYTDGYGTPESLTSTDVGPVVNVNDAPIGLPTITGTVTEDQILTANTAGISDADGLGAFGYQWLRDGAVIVGATSGTYTLGDADVGTQISVEVSYTDGYGTAESLTSTDVGPVVNVNDAPIGLPTITGTVTEDQILTANTAGISDADGLGAFGYQWLRDGAVIVGATSGTYTLGDADVGTQISVEVSYTDGYGTAESLTSTDVGPVVNVNDAPIGLPTITGTVTEDQILTANTAGISDADGLGAFGYQWLRDGAVIVGATSGTYTLGDADVGTQISVEVSYTDGYGTAESLTSTDVGPVVNVNDAPIGLPTITGTVTEDQILTANTAGISDADGLGAFGYQWLRDGAVIVGATSGTYTLGDADVGTQISVEVSYTDGHGTAESVTSAQTAAVVNVNDVPIGLPTISGTVTEDQTLTANTGGIADADGLGAFGYQWLRNGAVILGATSGTYTLGDADVGTQISVQVSYTDVHGTSEGPLVSAQTAPVVNVNDVPIGLPTITGTVTEDQTLTANTAGIADADGLGAFGYQWLRDGAVILGATSGTYTLGDADVGTQISVEVSYTDGHGTPESVTSAQTAPVVNVNDAPIGLPTITGTVTEDQTLTANTGGIADADGLGAFSYQWLRNGAAITSATASTYTLGDADVGTQISVQVSYTDGHGTAESVTSAQTVAVVNVNDAPIGLPTITGTVTEDQTLTANTGGIADADGLGAFGYQWLRNGAVILGATSGTYTLGDADVGTQISVQVSYTDVHGTSEGPLVSAQTAPVVNVNDVPIGVPTISGTVTEDQTLTANTGGIADADGLGAFGYQWLRNGAVILGATSGTYTLGDADVGTQISVQVSYTDGHGTPESVTSAQTAPVVNVNDAPTGVPTITGTVIEDQTLTANIGGIADADGLGALTYQWARSSDGGTTWVSMAGATANTYTLGDADVNALMQVSVSYTDAQGATESLTSAGVGPVANLNDAPVLTANSLSIGQGATLILSGTNLGASDVDDAASTLTFTVSNVANGRFELSGVPGVGITSFTQADVAGGVVVFVHDGSAITPSYAVTVSDGSLVDGPLWAGISFLPSAVVTPPVLPPPPVIVLTPVTNEPPAATEAAAQPEREAPASAPAQVVPALFSPGRIDPPEAQISSLEIHGLAVRRLIQPVATLNTFVSGPYIDPTLQLLAAAPANLEYLPSVPVDWSVRPAFPDAEEAPRDRIDVLLEQVQVGGMALSVGVVWWASRISGLLGSLLASAPAWRHIDPLPVVGRDEDEEKKWYDPNDRDAEANELAIDDVFEGAHTARGEQQA